MIVLYQKLIVWSYKNIISIFYLKHCDITLIQLTVEIPTYMSSVIVLKLCFQKEQKCINNNKKFNK